MGSDMWKNCLDCPYHDMEKNYLLTLKPQGVSFCNI